MQIFLIIALIIIALAVIFAVQNTAVITVSFFFWTYQGSLAIVLLVALCAGALISLLFSLPTILRDKWRIRSHKKKLAEVETSLADHKSKLEEAQQKLQAVETPPEESPTQQSSESP
jgi:putative membrane protein